MKKKIAVFTTGWGAEILGQFLDGMMNELKTENADLFMFLCYAAYADSPEKRQGGLNIYNLPDMHDFDGAVVFGSGLDWKDTVDNIIERCKEAGIPVIMQGSRREGLSFVGSDNYQAVKDLCAHVRNEHGARSLVFFAGTRDSHDSELRLKAVRDYLKENNCEDELKEVFYTNWENAAATRWVNETAEKGGKFPDVIICANDGLAMQTCVTLNENGLNVPEDILVTGFDYIDGGKIFDPSIASVDQCFDEMGAAAIRLWKKQTDEGIQEITEMVPCKFVPGESCNCYKYRDSDKLRRRMGRDAFALRSTTTYFNRKLDIIDSTILSCLTYLELKERLNSLLTDDHDYEGESFHLLMEPNFGLSIYDSNIKLNTNKYSKHMEVVYSSEQGKTFKGYDFESRDLIPGYADDGKNHLYIFLPIHEADNAYGYLVFKDCPEKLANHFLQNYYNRMCLALEKFRYALTLEHINKRLLDLMGRDPLTNVNNRMAYEDKEKHLQAEINSEPDCTFALAMFDVNSLKMINDSQGHEAGDAYLLRACHLICDVFKHSPVYRIGGDEFVAVLCGDDYNNRDALLKTLNELMSPYSDSMPIPSDYVSIACGISAYDGSKDSTVADVIKRADEAMYKDKAAKKNLS